MTQTNQNIQHGEQRRTIKNCKGKDQVAYEGRPRITPAFSMETPQARRPWIDALQTLRDHRRQPTLP